MGLAAVCRAIVNDAGDMIPCSLVLDGEYGYRKLSMAVPVVLGREGVREIQEWELAHDEQEELEKSAGILAPAMHYVEDFLKK